MALSNLKGGRGYEENEYLPIRRTAQETQGDVEKEGTQTLGDYQKDD